MSQPLLETFKLGFPWPTLDPFLFCVYHKDDYPRGNGSLGPDASLSGRQMGQDFTIKDGWRMYHGTQIPGFPAHPHRGFETLTVVQKGLVDHADSLGAAGRYGQGDLQWMTAGKGVQHSEMFPLIHTEQENPLELFQIWLNLPAKNKMAEPHFKMFWSDTIPRVKTQDSHGKSTEVTVYAGTYQNQTPPKPAPDSWAADANNEVRVWQITLEAGGIWTLPSCGKGVLRALYFYQGETLNIEDQELTVEHGGVVEQTQDLKVRNGARESKLLLLQGKPIKERVAQYGPFVMNTKAEIQQAFEDYQRTQFGGWPWPKSDQTHGDKERFAKHANGEIETPAV